MDNATKQKLIKLASYTRSASGNVDTGFASAPMPTKSLQVTPQQSRGNLFDKVKSVAGQTLGIAGQGSVMGAKFVANTAVDIAKAGKGTVQTAKDMFVHSNQAQRYAQESANIGYKQDQIMKEYKAGRMSKENYIKALDDVNKAFTAVTKENAKLQLGPSPVDRAKDVVETGVNLLTFGELTLAKVGAKEVAEAGGKSTIKALLEGGTANKLESLLLKFPTTRALIERNLSAGATRLASETTAQYVRREAQHVAANLLIKRPIFYQANIAQTESLYKNMMEGDYKGALTDSAWLGVQMVSGGPLGGGKWLAEKAGGKASALSYGKGSFIDELSSRIGDGNKAQIARFITKAQQRTTTVGKEIEDAFRVFETKNMTVTKGRAVEAVDNFLRTYTDAGIDLATLTPSQIYKDMDNWYKADKLWREASLAGKLKMTVQQAARYTPVKWDASTRNSIANVVRGAGDNPDDQLKAVLKVADNPGVGFGNNKNLMLRIEKIIGENQNAEKAAKAIQAIDAAQISQEYLDKSIVKKLNELGYVIAEPVGGRKVPFLDAEDTKKLVSGAIKGSEIFDPSQNPAPVFSTIAGMLERVGLSPREASNQTMRVVGDSVAESIHKTIAGRELGFNLKDTDIGIGGQVVVSRLQRWVENRPGIKALSSISQGKSAITDIRQMTVNEIQEALASVDAKGVKTLLDKSAAKEVRRAIVKGYQEVPLDVRGLGDRITDTLYSYNPLHKYYSRTQSALRYTYNPFFRVQEVSETKILSRIQSSNLLWNKSKAELDDAVKVLNNNNYFGDLGDNIVHGAANLPGEGANDQVLGRISATLSSGQKRDLGGLALDIANSRGVPLDTLLKESPEIIDDALRVVVQYSTKGALSSPLARTMNLVFFPVRYNAKVTKIAADALAKQPPSIQKAVLHSMFNARDWLQSEEGISWQSKNADVIQLFKWITPINSIESTLKLLTGSVNSMGDLGQLGGLPLGIITQILDGQGLINMNTPYVDPKTGNVFPDKVPATDKARAATALGDFINTLFTYPGRTLGLPGKRESINKAIGAVIDTDSSEYIQNIDMTKLTPLQEKWVNILQKGNATQDELDELYNTPNPGQFNWYTLPPINVPTITPTKPVQPVTPPKPSKSKGSKGKRPKTIARPIQLR